MEVRLNPSELAMKASETIIGPLFDAAVAEFELTRNLRVLQPIAIAVGGRFNLILVVDREPEARQLAELYRLDMIWPMSGSEAAKRFPDKFPHLYHPIHW
jgi:hypothetical protein